MTTEFERIVREHRTRWPLMEPRDYGKLAYQSEFGPEHLVTDPETMLARLQQEWETAEGTDRPPEPIGSGLCRFHLNAVEDESVSAAVLIKLFSLTAKETSGTREGLEKKLDFLANLPVPGMEEWLRGYRGLGCPPVGHSERYRNAYAPHYRLVKTDYARYVPALLEVEKLRRQGGGILAIDGRCGSGKSTLAELIARLYDCNVFRMDDFYLPQGERAENWRSIPGGNMDLGRFKREVLDPIQAGEPVWYRPFRCTSGSFGHGERIDPKPLNVVEGSYSHHPALGEPYGGKVFLTCGMEERVRRLQAREGDYFPTFQALWMPLEEQYIRAFDVEKRAGLVLDTGWL